MNELNEIEKEANNFFDWMEKRDKQEAIDFIKSTYLKGIKAGREEAIRAISKEEGWEERP